MLSVALKDFWIYMKDRGTIVNLFLLPLIFAVVLTAALGGVFKGTGTGSTVTIPLVVQRGNPSAITTLHHMPNVHWAAETTAAAQKAVSTSNALAAVKINGVHITIWESSTQASTAHLFAGDITASVQAAALRDQVLPLTVELVHLHQHLPAVNVLPVMTTKVLGLRSASISEPTAAQQYVPGFTVAFLFFIAATIVQSFFSERERGTMQRLRLTSLSTTTILVGKLLPTIAMGIIQSVVIFGVGRLLFHMPLRSPWALLVVTMAISLAANGLGLLVTAWSRTQALASSLATLLVFALAALGGCYVPQFFMPHIMQTLSLITPQGWAMHAYQAILLQGYGFTTVLPDILVLCGFAVVFFTVGLLKFRFEGISS